MSIEDITPSTPQPVTGYDSRDLEDWVCAKSALPYPFNLAAGKIARKVNSVQGYAFPSYEWIEAHLKISRSTFWRLRTLMVQSKEWVVVEGGKGRANRYYPTNVLLAGFDAWVQAGKPSFLAVSEEGGADEGIAQEEPTAVITQDAIAVAEDDQDDTAPLPEPENPAQPEPMPEAAPEPEPEPEPVMVAAPAASNAPQPRNPIEVALRGCLPERWSEYVETTPARERARIVGTARAWLATSEYAEPMIRAALRETPAPESISRWLIEEVLPFPARWLADARVPAHPYEVAIKNAVPERWEEYLDLGAAMRERICAKADTLAIPHAKYAPILAGALYANSEPGDLGDFLWIAVLDNWRTHEKNAHHAREAAVANEDAASEDEQQPVPEAESQSERAEPMDAVEALFASLTPYERDLQEHLPSYAWEQYLREVTSEKRAKIERRIAALEAEGYDHAEVLESAIARTTTTDWDVWGLLFGFAYKYPRRMDDSQRSRAEAARHGAFMMTGAGTEQVDYGHTGQEF